MIARSLDNPEVLYYGREVERHAAMSGAVGTAFDLLRAEFLSAVGSPGRVISTPAFFAKARMTYAEVINDSFAGSDGTAALHSLLVMLADAAKGDNIQPRAAMWLGDRARAHTEFHCGDLGVELLGEEDCL